MKNVFVKAGFKIDAFSTTKIIFDDIYGDEGYFLTRPLFKFISELISCILCTGTWVGFFFSLFYFSPSHEFIGLNKFLSVFFDGMLSAGSVWAINAIIEWFEENRPTKD